MVRLYSFWRSSSAYRVRIALGLKRQVWDTVTVDLTAGAQRRTDYAEVNPAQRVPTLETADGTRLTQSLAIIDWIDATWPEPPLIPGDPVRRAKVMAAAHVIAMDIQPLANSGALHVLDTDFGLDRRDVARWADFWMARGLAAFEALIADKATFCFGESPGLADICLVPQLYNARRAGVDLDPLPRLTEIEARCLELPAFQAAVPEAQPDATP